MTSWRRTVVSNSAPWLAMPWVTGATAIDKAGRGPMLRQAYASMANAVEAYRLFASAEKRPLVDVTGQDSGIQSWLRAGHHRNRLHSLARRKFFDLHVANKSQLAEQALCSIGGLYEVERQAKDMSDEDRWRLR